jgi:diamine N-acetyltransferase
MPFGSGMALTIRPAAPADAATVHALVGELAAYEKLSHEAVATVADIASALFEPPVRVFCEIAEVDGAPVGFALWFYVYSSFQGRHGLYLEDLYVRPDARRGGAGTALLRHLARRCAEEGLGRLSWSVLDWNQPAIDFYQRMGARLTSDWTGCHLDGPALIALAAP